MQPTRLFALGTLLALLSGCATRSIDLAPPRPDRPWLPSVLPSGEIKPGASARQGTDRTYPVPSNPEVGTLPVEWQIVSGHAYTLPELIDLAETDNPTARVAWDQAKQAALAVGLVRATYLPKITASAVGIDLMSHSDGAIDGAADGGRTNGRGALGSVSLQWLLFDFGERRALVAGAEQISIASDIRFNATHQKIIHDVSVAYYAAASAHQETRNAEQSLSDSLAVRTAVEQRQAHGQTTVVEVAQARQSSAQAKLAAVEAHGREAEAYVTLLTAIGVSPLTTLKLADIGDRMLVPQDASDAFSAVERALARRPDVLAAFSAEKAAKEGVDAAKADFRPKIFTSASASYQTGNLDVTSLPGAGGTDGSSNLNGSKRSANIIVGVSIPLFDGGTRAARLGRARAEADAAAAEFDDIRDQAVRQIVMARSSLETGIAAYDAAQDLQAAAQVSFDAAIGAYRNGVGNLTDVSSAQSALMNARNARSTAYTNAQTAAATLALATGALAETPGL